MHKIWSHITRKTNHDCTYLIQKKYFKIKHQYFLQYCFIQMKDIFLEQQYLINLWLRGDLHVKPLTDYYKFILFCNKTKLILNNY